MAQQNYFSVGAVQPEVYYCKDRKEIREKNLRRHLELLDCLVPYWSSLVGAPCRLVVFPEFALHGIPQKADGSWNGVAIDIPGEETELLGEKAKELNIYIASHGWTEYPDFPSRPFSVAFLIGPNGKVILRHHKVVTTKILDATAPGDAYDWFVKKFGEGLDAFFPVADTELGKMGFIICGEGQYPEIARGLMINGAEILIRPNAWIEPYMTEPQDLMALCSRFNAFANMCYLVESNWAYYYGAGYQGPKGFGAGRSQIIDYTGRILARSYAAGETGIATEINIQSLRRYREGCGFGARMVYIPCHIFRKVYETEIWPKNSLLKKKESGNIIMWEKLRREVIERRRDIYTPSEKTKGTT